LALSDYSNGGTMMTSRQEESYWGKYNFSLSDGNIHYAGEVKIKDL